MDAKGKLIKDKWSTIGDKKYAFDGDGKMRTGWFLIMMIFIIWETMVMPRPAGCAWTMTKTTSRMMERSLKSVLLLPILPNGFISRQTERQNVLRMTPIPLKPSGIINIILMIFIYQSIAKQKFNQIDFLINHTHFIKKLICKYYSLKFAIYYNELLIQHYDTTSIIETYMIK